MRGTLICIDSLLPIYNIQMVATNWYNGGLHSNIGVLLIHEHWNGRWKMRVDTKSQSWWVCAYCEHFQLHKCIWLLNLWAEILIILALVNEEECPWDLHSITNSMIHEVVFFFCKVSVLRFTMHLASHMCFN
jgi:hypothetical protein